ncbi:extracellular solute-binding protein [Streptomyces sp. NPDC048650]|uniref:extracellular solute-binding protein n=1 Tax=Streptomyces sp. NPDC048650 TaxID=3365583 RepID=UPI003715649A
MRRRLFLSRTAGMAGAAAWGLTGCGSEGDTGGRDVTLSLLAASYGKSVGASIVDRWHATIAAFEKRHPHIRIDLELVPIGRIDATLARRVRNGNAPDIAQSYAFADYAEAHQLYRAEELFDVTTQADFITSFARAGEVGFVEYGIPFLASTPRLFYHKGLFARAGVAGPPSSWAELRSTAAALKAAGVKTPYGLQLGPEAAEDEALAWMLAAGGGYSGPSGYDFAKKENVETLDWLKSRLVAPGLAGDDPARFSRTPAYAAFLKGEVGMMLAHPVLIKAAEQARLAYGHAAFPMRHGNGAAPPVGLSDWLMAFNRGGHRKECAAFLAFLFTNKDAARFAAGQGTLPVTVSGSESLHRQQTQRPLWKFVDQMPKAEFHPVNRSSWPKVRDAVRDRIGDAVMAHGDPRSTLDGLQLTANLAESRTTPTT